MCEALATGTGLPLVPPTPLRDGGVAMYGFLRGLGTTLDEARARSRPWVYADRGYFRATYGDDYSGYFRVTRDAYQLSGLTFGLPERWPRLGIELKPMRERGAHVLVCPPGDVYARYVGGFAATDWLDKTLATLRRFTDRELRVRLKAERDRRPLRADLAGCHAVVTFMSNVAVEALVAGVPVFTDRKSAAATLARTTLSDIEDPLVPSDFQRVAWAEALAANQWTLAEIATGAANHLFFGDLD